MSKASSDQSLSFSAAGVKFQLGMVYNAYKHELIKSLNLLEKCPDVGRRSRLCPSLSLDLKSSYTINERIEGVRFSGHVKVGAVFGFFKLGSASADYINDKSSSIGQARMTLHYKHIKRYEELDTETIHTLYGNYEVLKLARERGATHFVAGVTYGNRVLIDYKFIKRDEKEHDRVDIQLEGALRLGQALADNFNKDEKRATNFDDIRCYFFCDSIDKVPRDSDSTDIIPRDIDSDSDSRGMKFREAQGIYQNLPTILQDVEAVDSVYLLPLSIIDTNARRFKQSDIDEVAMQKLVHIRDDLYEQEMQCEAMEKRGINTSKIKDDIQQYTDKLKRTLSSTSVESWNELVVQHNSSGFEMHKFQHRLKEEFHLFQARTCRTCKKEFSTESEFAQHMMDHEPRACRRCNNKFSTENELAQHMKIHEDRTCHRCKKEFSTESELVKHMSDKKAYRCLWCGNEFSTKNELDQHQGIHIARWCRHCYKEFSTESELMQHQKDIMARICRRCEKEFSTESAFTQHTKDVVARPCCRCSEEFCTDSELASHMELYHARTCRNCKKDFFTESELEQHMLIHEARTCGRCFKEFVTESELAQHIEDVEVRPCCKCDKDFCTENDLAQHLKSYHGLHTIE